jgi:hypothetical protein
LMIHGAIRPSVVRPAIKVCRRRDARTNGAPRLHPKARWCAGMQASALQGPPTRPRHVGFDGGLVNEDQPVRCLPHHGLAMAYPIGPGAPDRGAAPLIRDQRLFLTVKPCAARHGRVRPGSPRRLPPQEGLRKVRPASCQGRRGRPNPGRHPVHHGGRRRRLGP